jgi:thiamine biosynthesis lipoprotein ApbE
MKKGLKVLVIIPLLSVLFSCGQTSSSSSSVSYTAYQSYASPIMPDSGTIHISDKDGNVLTGTGAVYPFNTSLILIYYVFKGASTDPTFEDDFSYWMQHYNALLDRHHYYVEDGKLLTNVASINDAYGTGKSLVLDPVLYNSLKKSYDFSINSSDKFSIAIGNLSTLWDYFISASADFEGDNAANAEDSYAQQRVIFSDPDPLLLELALQTTPTSEELKQMLTFDDASSSVVFNSVPRIDAFVQSEKGKADLTLANSLGFDFSKPSLTLGGFGKGEATQLFADRHPERNYLINSGSSSVKCTGAKPDDSPWALTIANPYYHEASRVAYYDNLKMNSADLVLKRGGTFDLSTSGYYENYFYVKQTDGSYILRDHIIDPLSGYSHTYFASASVLVSDSGYADMYTTALMNCDSLEEAKDIITKLNAFTKQEAVPYFIVNSLEADGSKKETCYADASLIGDLYQTHDLYPSSFSEASITSVVSI